ncbi:MAG: tetratricopeptide repeat protein [Planctomycetes bacterium]|nr:tetratricopeptide repeat protein [Planctomycetota bacterium]
MPLCAAVVAFLVGATGSSGLCAAAAQRASASATPRASLQASSAPVVRPIGGESEAIRGLRALVEQRRFIDAAKAGEALVKKQPDDGEAWLALAYVHLSPDWPFRRDARAKSAATRALKVLGRRPDVISALAVAHARLVEFDEALPLIAELCDGAPPPVAGAKLAELLVLRADIAIKRGASDPAATVTMLGDLDRAIAAAPRSAAARVMRAEALMHADRHKEALTDLNVAIDAAPGHKAAHAAMRVCCQRTGDREGARRHLEIWKRLNRLTDSVASASAPDDEERRVILRELAELNPLDVEHRLQFAALELKLGDADAAIRLCDALLSVVPEWPPAWHLREQAHLTKRGIRPAAAPEAGGENEAEGDGGAP